MAGVTARLASNKACWEVVADFTGGQIAGGVVNRKVDAQPDQDHPEGHAQNIQVSHGQRQVSTGPQDGQQQRGGGQRGIAETTEARREHQHHTDQAGDARPGHVVLANPHLVIFDDRQPRQPKFHFGVPQLYRLGQLPQLHDSLTTADEALSRGGQTERDQTELAVMEQLIGGKAFPHRIGDRCEWPARAARGCPRPGQFRHRLIARRGRGREHRQVGRRRRRTDGGEQVTQSGRRVVQQGSDPDDGGLQLLQLSDGQEMQPLGHQAGGVEAVVHILKKLRLALQFGTELIHDRSDGGGLVAGDNQHDFLGIAEFLQIFQPTLVKLAARTQQIGPLRVEAQSQKGDHQR